MRQLWLDLQADRLITDKAFDDDKRVLEPSADGKKAVIPPKANRRQSRRFDRHLIENFFAKLKRPRAIATRYDNTARDFLAAIHLAATVIRLN
jgi:transposase